MPKRLFKKTEERLENLLTEIYDFARENEISLKEAFDVKLIDDLRGISHRFYNGLSPLRENKNKGSKSKGGI